MVRPLPMEDAGRAMPTMSPGSVRASQAPGHDLPAALELHGFARLAPLVAWLAILAAGLAGGPASLNAPLFVGGAVGWFLPGLVMAFVPWIRIPSPVRLVPVAAYLVGLMAFRHGLGGAGPGISLLALIPILWLGANGTPRQLAAGVALMLIAVSAPIVLVGAPDYPPTEWQRVVVLAGVGGFAGYATHRLVSDVRHQSERARRQSIELSDQVVVTEAIVETADDAVISFEESGGVLGFNAAAREMLGWGDDSPEGFDLFDTFVVARDRSRLRAGFERLLAGLDAAEAATGRPGRARQPRFETELIRRDGTLVPVEATVGAAGVRGQRRVHAFARDITARRVAERASRAHLDDLARLLSVARDLGRPTSATDGRQAICDAARDLTGADVTLFFEARPAEGLLVSTGASGDGEVPRDVTLEVRRSLTALVFATGEATFVGDLLADERVDRVTAARMGVRAAYWQPVLRDGRPIGILVNYWRRPQAEVSERVSSLLELFATQAAVVVERADLMGRLENLARTDPLTGLANRRAFEETMVRELASAERADHLLSLVMLDLDRFKEYNDRRGHQAGDSLLREVAAAWLAELRPSDTLVRFGGEEFIAVLPACETAVAAAIADRLRRHVPGGETVSAGVATWDRSETMTDLVARADAALYAAKRLGRDRTETAAATVRRPPPPPPPSAATRHARRRADLRIAG